MSMALHRPYIRKATRIEVESRAEKNDKGQFLDVHTHQPIDGKYDLGHKAEHEYWREAQKAEKEGLTQKQFNDKMNNPDIYQIESPHENRSHAHEMPKTQTNNNTQNINNVNKGGKTAMGRNEFLDSIKADKATIDKTNQVSQNTAKNMNVQSGKKGGLDNGGYERGDSTSAPLSHGRESGNKGGVAPTSHSGSSGQVPTSNSQGNSEGHSSGGQSSSSGHGSVGSSSGGGHSSGASGTGGHGSGGQGSGGHGGSTGGSGGGHGGH